MRMAVAPDWGRGVWQGLQVQAPLPATSRGLFRHLFGRHCRVCSSDVSRDPSSHVGVRTIHPFLREGLFSLVARMSSGRRVTRAPKTRGRWRLARGAARGVTWGVCRFSSLSAGSARVTGPGMIHAQLEQTLVASNPGVIVADGPFRMTSDEGRRQWILRRVSLQS